MSSSTEDMIGILSGILFVAKKMHYSATSQTICIRVRFRFLRCTYLLSSSRLFALRIAIFWVICFDCPVHCEVNDHVLQISGAKPTDTFLCTFPDHFEKDERQKLTRIK